MKELNDYNIHNADGNVPCSNEGKVAFENDSPRYISESLQSEQGEAFRARESFEPSEQADFGSMEVGGMDASSSASSASSAASASSSVASAASSIGGSFGALAGVVASSVATVAMVVAVFVSTLVINLTLAMADMHSLVFQLEMTGAQEEDFEDPIWAVLTSDDGAYQEQEVKQDTVMLTFEGLEPNTEYLIRIKNSEKVFVKKTFFTASKPVDKGKLLASMNGTDVVVSVKDIKLSRGEYYTVTVKDAKGNVVFSKDSVDANAEYRFTVDEPKSLYFAASINGKSFALYEIEYASKPGVTHVHIYGDLIAETFADCEKQGMAAHYYCEECGKFFNEDKEEVTEESLITEAYGHYYNWVETKDAGCETPGMESHYQCTKCGKLFNILKKEVSEESLNIRPYGHYYGSLITATPADCDTNGMAAYYRCDRCGKCFDEDKNETTEEELIIGALGHEVGPLVERVKATSYTVQDGILPHYVCAHCGRYFADEDAEEELFELNYRLTYANPTWTWTYDGNGVPVSATATFEEVHGDETIILNANILRRYTQSTDCETPTYGYCTADVTLNEQTYNTYEADYSERFVVEPAVGHAYGEPAFTWTPAESGGYEARATFTCSREGCGHQETVNAEVTFDNDVYNASVLLDDVYYYDSFDPNVNVLFTEDDRALYVTPSKYGRTNAETAPALSDMTSFVTSPYCFIKVSGIYEGWDYAINVYQTDDSEEESNVYLCFDNLTLTSASRGTAMRFSATTVLNVHIAFRGTSTLYSGGNPLFYSEGGTVNVYLYIYDNEAGNNLTLDFEEAYNGSLYSAESGSINVYVPGEEDEWATVPASYKLKPATPAGSGVASVDDGYVRVYADGYTDANGEYSFENTSTSNYVISGECTGDNPLVINTSNKDGSSAGVQKVTYYLTFDNLTLEASSWASAFCIKTSCNLELHIVYKGAVSITGYNHPAFSLEGGYDIIVYMEAYDSASTFNYGRQYGSSPKLYGSGDNSYGGNVRFVLDGSEVDLDGNVL